MLPPENRFFEWYMPYEKTVIQKGGAQLSFELKIQKIRRKNL